MKSEVKFKVRSLNFAQPVGKFTSDFIRGEKMCCHICWVSVCAEIGMDVYHRNDRNFIDDVGGRVYGFMANSSGVAGIYYYSAVSIVASVSGCTRSGIG